MLHQFPDGKVILVWKLSHEVDLKFFLIYKVPTNYLLRIYKLYFYLKINFYNEILFYLNISERGNIVLLIDKS